MENDLENIKNIIDKYQDVNITYCNCYDHKGTSNKKIVIEYGFEEKSD